jgi:hypothetical protein
MYIFSNIARDYDYALTNGYDGTFGEYVKHRVESENKIRRRCDLPEVKLADVIYYITVHGFTHSRYPLIVE